jgi:hypothetical protein
MDDHSLAVDVADLQVSHFCATCACGIESHQWDAVEGKLCRINQTRDLPWLNISGRFRTFFG